MLIDIGPIQLDDSVLMRQLKNDLRDDWFPDPRRFEDIFEQSHVQKTISENFKNNHGTYRPNKRDLLNVPKPNFTLRYGLEISIADRAVYHALTAYLVPFYDILIPWNVYSHRHANNTDPKFLFRKAVNAWQDFIGVTRAALKKKPFLLSTDLTNYFENIDIEKLKQEMIALLPEIDATPAQKSHIRADIDVLFSCLPKWCYSSASGLPQNRDASSFLANVYMLAVDRAMLGRNYQYYRYMDDIKIACSDEFEARKALKDLALELRKLGLSINSGKTIICKPDEVDEINKCLDSGGDEFRQIAAIWKTRSLKPISRSFSLLRELSLKELRGENVNSRAFRFCVRRLIMLATCPEFTVPPEFFEQITALAINAIPAFPAATDQLAQYLCAVHLTPAQLREISTYIQNPKKSFYTWQNYRLWFLLIQKEYREDRLMRHALDLVSKGDDNANRCGATLYLGAMGAKSDRIRIAENFSTVNSFLGQRSALVAVQELHYNPYIKNLVQPFLRDDLREVYRGLNRKGIYVAAPEEISITSVIDIERDYE